MKKIKKTRPQKFIEFTALGDAPYRAAIKAGYSEKYAAAFSHKLLERYRNDIEALRPKMQKTIEEEFKYTVKESFNKLNEIQSLALLQDEKGNFTNLSAAIKAEELKGKMYGVYEADNKQKQASIIIKDDI